MIIAATAYALVVNALTFIAFWRDKRCAGRGARRIPERTLLTLAALGGSLGAFAGLRLIRHKTRKKPFCKRLIVVATIQVALVIACCALYANSF